MKNSVFPIILSLIGNFKICCKCRGWYAYESDDLIEAKNEYHKFFWIHLLHLETFKKVTSNFTCYICEGISLRKLSLSYMAWILHETPKPSILQHIFEEMPNLSRKVAFYDLSRVYKGEPTCLRLNETESVVFQEFERFLKKEHGIKFIQYEYKQSSTSHSNEREMHEKLLKLNPKITE